jgi:hypothetical protein
MRRIQNYAEENLHESVHLEDLEGCDTKKDLTIEDVRWTNLTQDGVQYWTSI